MLIRKYKLQRGLIILGKMMRVASCYNGIVHTLAVVDSDLGHNFLGFYA